MMSTPPPAACGTMIRTGRAGYCCAATPPANRAVTAATSTICRTILSSSDCSGDREMELLSRSRAPPSRIFRLRRAAGALLSRRAQDLHQAARGFELLEARDRVDGFLDCRLRQQRLAVAAELVFD